MIIKTDTHKWLFVGAMTLVSVMLSVTITWLVSPSHGAIIGLGIATLVPLLVAPIASLVTAQMMLRIYRLNQSLHYMAHHDQMTGLLNRKAFFDGVEKAATPKGSVILADIDKFKSINDTYGHQVGDLVICKVAEILRDKSRQTGIAARLGGEEFVAFYPDTCVTEATQRAEDIRTTIAAQTLDVDGTTIHCTLSIGIAFCDGARPMDDYLKAADQALYCAKRAGRNQVIRHTSSSPCTHGRPQTILPDQMTEMCLQSAGPNR